MSTKPLIAVAGAAGKQGRSVAAALLRSGGGGARARSHPKSECLTGASPGAGGCGGRRCAASLGQEETWLKAFRGADGVFLMTPPTPPENSGEFEPGCRLADAAV